MLTQAHILPREQSIPLPVHEVFEFFARPENLQTITPAWLDFRILETPRALRKGSLIRYALRWRGIPLRWTTEITEWDPPHGFVDTQVSGPYALWRHVHRFAPDGSNTRIYDVVSYILPFWALGAVVHRAFVARDLRSIFDYRQRRVQELLRAGNGGTGGGKSVGD